MNNDLIRRQNAINAIENTECELLPEEWDELTKAIKQVPSAEPEIIRCKDCEWCEEHYDIDGIPYWVCKNWVGGTDADGFCHEAERRTDE